MGRRGGGGDGGGGGGGCGGGGDGGGGGGGGDGHSPIPTVPVVEDEALGTLVGIVRDLPFFNAEARRSSAASSSRLQPRGSFRPPEGIYQPDALE